MATPEPQYTVFEQAAVEAAWEAGALVAKRFGGPLDVSSKSKEPGKELVTDVDRASQKLISALTAERFAGHSLLGEEEPPDREPPATDYLWAVDPIDGTTNFVNGLPLHAVAIGLLHRGRPVAAAVWMPWPTPAGAGVVAHASAGGGSWLSGARVGQGNGRRLEIKEAGGDGMPVTGRLSAIPGSLRWGYRVGKKLRKGIGEPRVSGSTAFETAMVATGVMQFSVSGSGSHVWDYAATSLLVREAGGAVYALNGRREWEPFEGWTPFANDSATSERLRKWTGPMLMASPRLARSVATELTPRKPPLWKRLGSRK
jgi:myo-inositol-1(or 4)-monophosphatase